MADTQPTVWIVRHGKTALNQGGETSVDRIRGWSDVPLDATGQAEARRLAQRLKGEPIQLIVTSDLDRAVETAEALRETLGKRVVETRAFRPWHLGTLTGKPSTEAAPVIAEYATECPNRPVTGGESFKEFKGRFLKGLEDVLQFAQETGIDVAIVTHYRGLRLIQGWLAGDQKRQIDLPAFLHHDPDESPAAVLKLRRTGKRWKGELWSKGEK